MGGRARLPTPLLLVQLPRRGADPPPTSRGAAARVPTPRGRPASAVPPGETSTDRPGRRSHCVPALHRREGTHPSAGVPTWLPSAQQEVEDDGDRSRWASGAGPRAPRVAGPPFPIIPQAMKCWGMASSVLCSFTKWKGSFPPAQTEKGTEAAESRAGRTQDRG